VAQNITSAPYKRVSGLTDGVGGGLRLPFRHNVTTFFVKEAVSGPQTTLQGEVGHLITVMDDWEQFHTNARQAFLQSYQSSTGS